MTNSRLDQLKQFWRESPNDPFLLYGIAMEYAKSDPAKAEQSFDQLLEQFEEYLPAYYQAASLYAELGREDKARSAYKKGLLIAAQQQDLHTQRELQNAYQNFLLDLDEE